MYRQCKIGQTNRCRYSGCEWLKGFGYTCFGAQAKNQYVPTYDEAVAGMEPYKIETIVVAKAGKIKPRRHNIWQSTRGICYLCGLPVSLEEFTIDHVIPKSKGGKNTHSNLRPTHYRCNLEKGNKILEANKK